MHALKLCLSCCYVTPRATPFAQTHPGLPRIGVEPPEQLGGGRFLQFDGGNEAEHLVPLRFNEGLFDIPIGQQRVALLGVLPAFAEPIELLVFEALNPWGKSKP